MKRKYSRRWNKTRFCGDCGKKLGRWAHLLNWCGWLKCKHSQISVKKYIVKPGVVRSIADGQVYFISAIALINLYKVKPSECYIADRPEKLQSIRGLTGKLKWLVPREDGDYKL